MTCTLYPQRLNSGSGQGRHLQPAKHGCHALVTSRHENKYQLTLLFPD